MLPLRLVVVLAAAAAMLLLAACEKPDASHVTSPSARALLGTTTGATAYGLPDDAPAPVANPQGWNVRLENARFSELENGVPSIQVVMQVESRPGPEFEVWLHGPEGTALRWSGGSARAYNGVVCFQLVLEDDGQALALGDGPYQMTAVFRYPGDAVPVVAQVQKVAGTPPHLNGSAASTDSSVARVLLGCPRSVI